MAKPLANNGLITIRGYGDYRVIVTSIDHGMNVVASESQSRHGAAFYPTKRTSGSFEIGLIFRNYDDRQHFCGWIERYLRRKADPNASMSVGEMDVIVPRFNFFKSGIVDTSLPFGDRVGQITHSVAMGFIGTNDRLDVQDPYVRSRFIASTNPESDPALPYLTPSDTQLSGDRYGNDLLGGPDAVAELARAWGSVGYGGLADYRNDNNRGSNSDRVPGSIGTPL